MGMLSKLISTYMQRNMCHYWYSAHDLHTISAGHNIGNKYGHYLLLHTPPKITNQLHMSWIIHYYNFTRIHWSLPVANIKAKIFPFKCDPIILFKILKELAYLCITLIPEWELGFSCLLPKLWARRFSSVPLTWASAEHAHILKDLLESLESTI